MSNAEIALQAQVVLIDVWSAQVRIIQIDSTGGIDRQERREVDVRGRGFRWKGIRHAQTNAVAVRVVIACILEGMAHIGQGCGHGATGDTVDTRGRQVVWRSVEESRGAHEWRLAVELKIVFAFQDVIENAYAAANAGLAGSGRVPSKSEARCEVFLVGEVRSAGGAGVAGKHQSQRRVVNRCD